MNVKRLKLVSITIFILAFTLSVQGEEKNYISNRLPDHLKIMQELLEFSTTSIDLKEGDLSDPATAKRISFSIATIAGQEKNIQSLKELAVLVWHTGSLGIHDNHDDKDFTWNVFLIAFDAIITKISEDTSDKAVKALREIGNRVQLGAGESHDFDRLKEKQLKKLEEELANAKNKK